MGKAWTREEDQILLDGAGVFAVDWFCRKTGRSRASLYSRTQHLYGPGGLSRGTYSLESASAETGYTREQLLRAQSALDQKWKRLSSRGRFLITFEQLQAMVEWLKHDYWCSKLRLYGCVNCGSSARPPRGMGLCPTDYWRVRRLCKRLGLPTTLDGLVNSIEGLTSPSLVILRERLAKGWGPTIDQARELAKILQES